MEPETYGINEIWDISDRLLFSNSEVFKCILNR
jgi:hypothetical protein